MKEKDLHKLIFSVFHQSSEIIVGPGDDCAAIDIGKEKLLLIAVDQLISDIHYDSKKTSPSDMAKKLLNRNLSDIAAMGGYPAYALLTLAANPAASKSQQTGSTDDWYYEFLNSLSKEAERWDVSICGGDLSSINSETVAATLTITGWVNKNKICLRYPAKTGDLLYATGSFGNSFASGHHLSFTPRIKEADFIAGTYSRVMIDVSDGLLADAEQIVKKSNLGLIIDLDKIPLRSGASLKNALGDGEDYELLFAVPATLVEKLEKKWPFSDVLLTKIGEFTDGNRGKISDKNGRNLSKIYKTGFEHFDE